MSRRLGALPGLAAVAWLAALPPASAQTAVGRMSGIVRDATGIPRPGATVRVTHEETGLARSGTTDARGAYAVLNLPPGDYRVRVELPGFENAEMAGCALAAGAHLEADFRLEPGTSAEAPRAAPAAVSPGTTTGGISRTMDRAATETVALNGRNSLQLATLIPGTPQPTADALEVLTGLGIDLSIDGGRQNANLLTVDGGFNLDSGSHNSQVTSLGIDFIDQVRVLTSSVPAAGRRHAGVTIDVVTRGGTNRFKGSVFEYARRDRLDANGYFSNLEGVGKAPLASDDFGGTVGGPLVRNRAFFFGGVEWRRIRRFTSPTFRDIPTTAMRAGDFSSIPTTLRNPYTGRAFANNTIPAALMTPDGRAIASVYAAMASAAVSYDDSRTSDSALFQRASPFDFRQEMLRVDIRSGGAHRLVTRLVFDQSTSVAPFGAYISSQLPTIPTERVRPGRSVQFTHGWNTGSRLANEATFNFSGIAQETRPVGSAWKRATYGFVFPQIYAGGAFVDSIPNVDVGGFASFRGASGALDSPGWDCSFSDSLTWLAGAHTLQAGGLLTYNRKSQNGQADYAGAVSFATSGNAMTTGNAFADALLGNFRSYEEAQDDPVGDFRFHQVEAYASDSWRVSRGLSVEAGVRYAWQMPTVTRGNNTASFAPERYDVSDEVVITAGGIVLPNSGNRFNGLTRAGEVPSDQASTGPNGASPLVRQVPIASSRGYYRDQSLFAPSVSFAWKPTEAGSTAVRGGVGLSYDRPEGNIAFPLLRNPPFVLSATYLTGNLSNPSGGTPAALTPWGTIESIDPGLRVPRTWKWSLGVQRELPWYGMRGEIAYLGNRGVNLLRRPDINAASFEDLTRNIALKYSTDFWRPYKGYSAIRMYVSDGRSDYQALQVLVSRRRGSANFTVNYTLSRSRDTASSNTDGVDPGGSGQDYYYGPSSHDRRHVLVATWTYRVPFFESGHGLSAGLLGGWEVSGIYRYQSGAPFTVTGETGIGTRRADYLGGTPYAFSVDEATGAVAWLDTTRFAVAPDTRLGNSGRNAFAGPSYRSWDISIRKQFALPGPARLLFQADVFNAFNQVNYNNPAASITGSTPFGTITSAAPPRNVQLGVRLTF